MYESVNRMHRKIVAAASIVLLMLGIGALVIKGSSDKPMTASQSAPATSTNQVEIRNYAYSSDKLAIKAGTTVTWKNYDAVAHTVTGDDNKGPHSELLSRNEAYSYTFSEPGTYDYYCKPHTFMKATVVVE